MVDRKESVDIGALKDVLLFKGVELKSSKVSLKAVLYRTSSRLRAGFRPFLRAPPAGYACPGRDPPPAA